MLCQINQSRTLNLWIAVIISSGVIKNDSRFMFAVFKKYILKKTKKWQLILFYVFMSFLTTQKKNRRQKISVFLNVLK